PLVTTPVSFLGYTPTAPTVTATLSLHDALPIFLGRRNFRGESFLRTLAGREQLGDLSIRVVQRLQQLPSLELLHANPRELRKQRELFLAQLREPDAGLLELRIERFGFAAQLAEGLIHGGECLAAAQHLRFTIP